MVTYQSIKNFGKKVLVVAGLTAILNGCEISSPPKYEQSPPKSYYNILFDGIIEVIDEDRLRNTHLSYGPDGIIRPIPTKKEHAILVSTNHNRKGVLRRDTNYKLPGENAEILLIRKEDGTDIRYRDSEPLGSLDEIEIDNTIYEGDDITQQMKSEYEIYRSRIVIEKKE